MTEQIIQPKSLGAYIRCLSGLFITKDNPNGLSPKELTVLACLLALVGDASKELDADVRLEASNQLNQSYQVTTNYINKFRKKGAVTKDNRLHPVFFKKRIVIEYGEDIL